MRALVTAGAGFLLAVLWFDLMFDVQVLRHRREADLPEGVLASIAGYYRRVTTEARPMNRLVMLAMAVTLVALVSDVAGTGDVPLWAALVSLVLAGAPITIAGTRTVPRAVRLGQRTDPVEWQTVAARAICREHLFCVACIGALLIVQLAVPSR